MFYLGNTKLKALTLCAFFVLTTQAVAQEQINAHILNCMKPSGHHVVEETKICPVGGETFQTVALGIYSTFGRSLDMKPASYLSLPPPIPVCPSNGFVMYRDDFSKEKLQEIEAYISTNTYQKLFAERHASYYLYYVLRQNVDVDLAAPAWWLALSASWEADGCKDADKYKEYASLALSDAIVALSNSKPDEASYWMLKILIPNLHRRLGDFENAQVWVDKFGKDMPEDQKQKEYMALALKVLKKAIDEKNTGRVFVEEPKE